MLGPRGGLPAARGELSRLADLLGVVVEEEMTVAKIKEFCKYFLIYF